VELSSTHHPSDRATVHRPSRFAAVSATVHPAGGTVRSGHEAAPLTVTRPSSATAKESPRRAGAESETHEVAARAARRRVVVGLRGLALISVAAAHVKPSPHR
jgi:hypothetical protein